MSIQNSVRLIGNLGAAPETKFTSAGTQFTTFSLAVERYDSTAKDHKRTDWFRCVGWNKVSERLTALDLQTGTMMDVMGEVQLNEWIDQATGKKQYGVEISIQDFKPLSRPQREASNGASNGYHDRPASRPHAPLEGLAEEEEYADYEPAPIPSSVVPASRIPRPPAVQAQAQAQATSTTTLPPAAARTARPRPAPAPVVHTAPTLGEELEPDTDPDDAPAERPTRRQLPF